MSIFFVLMIRRPPRSTLDRSSAASDVYKRQAFGVLNSRLAEAIDGIEMVKSTAQETAEVGRFEANARVFRDATVAQGREEAKFVPLLLLGITEAIGSVSYTHLRAHETVLDLVCRLLLEKK